MRLLSVIIAIRRHSRTVVVRCYSVGQVGMSALHCITSQQCTYSEGGFTRSDFDTLRAPQSSRYAITVGSASHGFFVVGDESRSGREAAEDRTGSVRVDGAA